MDAQEAIARNRIAYWSIGPQRVRLPGFDLHWAGWDGMTREQARVLRDGLDHALKQAERADREGWNG